MPRYIDADKLKADFVLFGNSYYTAQAIEFVIDAQPTVDAVPVVRCKDCEYSVTTDWSSDEVYCTKHNSWFKINGYCHLGRRENAKIN